MRDIIIGVKSTFLIILLTISSQLWAQTEEDCQAISMEAIEKAREDKFAESLALLTKARLMAEKNNWRVSRS